MSSIQQGILAISHEPANHPIVKQFFRFAAAVAVVPIFVYILVSQMTRLVTTASTGFLSPPILGGLAAVLSLNIVMGMFAILALRERMPSQPIVSTGSEVEEEEEEEGDGGTTHESETDHAKTE